MSFAWRKLDIPRFFGVNLKSNVIDVKDGVSLDADNCFQNADGVVSKRNGNDVMFTADDGVGEVQAEVGECTILGQKYYFKFSNGKFHHSETRDGDLTTITPSPAIDTTAQIWTAVLDNKLFFVDGTNALRYFDGTDIFVSSIPVRPTVAFSNSPAGTGFDYTYTVDNRLGESPAIPYGTSAGQSGIVNKGSAVTVRVPVDTGDENLQEGFIVRIYSKATTVAAASKLVATHMVTSGDISTGYIDIATVAISDAQPQLYTELGLAVNKSAPVGLKGIAEHYGRLVGWYGDYVADAKSSNPHAWPDNSAVGEAFVYGFGVGDGEEIQSCTSFRESLFVTKPTKIAVFGGVGPDDSGGNAYSYRRLETNGIGNIAPKSAVVIGEEDSGFLVFLSRVGFYGTNGDKPIRVGESIETELIPLSETNLSSAVAIHHKRLGLYLCWVGSPSGRIIWVYDTRKDENTAVGWFPWSGIPVSAVAWDESEAQYIFGTYNGWCGFERNAKSRLDFSDVGIEFLTTTNFNATSNEITVAGTFEAGDQIQFRSSGTLPAGITANDTYFVIPVSAGVIKIGETEDDALAGTAVNFTDVGTGDFSLIYKVAIDAYYTTNWIRFGDTALVKKLAKPCVTLNAVAASANITMRVAYDWKPAFGDPHVISVGSSHLWGDAAFPWGSFIWGDGAVATPRNVAISRRKCRSVRYKFENNTIDQDFDLQGISQEFAMIRNRGNFS